MKFTPPFLLSTRKEFDPGNYLIDFFSDCFSFHPQSKNIKNHIKALNNITLKSSSDPVCYKMRKYGQTSVR